MSSAVFKESNPDVYIVTKNGVEQHANVIDKNTAGQVYVHYLNTDKRNDEWVPEDIVRAASEHEAQMAAPSPSSRKRKRGESIQADSELHDIVDVDGDFEQGATNQVRELTEEEYDLQQHRKLYAKRNFDKVIFGHWQIKTWYYSPFPITESEVQEQNSSTFRDPSTPQQNPGQRAVSRTASRGHGRTLDLLAGGLIRNHARAEQSILWVCDRCFKYMADGTLWECHVKKCTRKHPPGRKVYQRGAHTIWEVDGAKDKLYCQNLSLFGKLFIDIKTLFFDTDNFLFYILTDADSQRDHVLGFFSKEKVSYDDYNLACIVVLPPYQRKGYGMLMIEFSYELCRRAGKVGTPERPLSDLGLRSYLAYWVATIVRFMRRLLSVLPPTVSQRSSQVFDTNFMSATRRDNTPAAEQENGNNRRTKRRKSTKGWDGEIDVNVDLPTAPDSVVDDPLFTSLRSFVTTINTDGSATTHVVMKCTLSDIARATNLRIEDATFAMNECGMLRIRGKEKEEDEGAIMMTREMVEKVAKERNVKRMCLDLVHVLL